MQRTKELKLDDRIYFVTQYPATKGVKLLANLAKLLGKPLVMLTGGNMDTEVKPEALGEAFESIAMQLSDDDFLDLITNILSSTQIQMDGKTRDIVFNTDFSGNYLHLFKLIKEILFFQYNDFLGQITGGSIELPVKKVSKIKAR